MIFPTWRIIAFDGAAHEMTLPGHPCRGYNISPVGSLVGLVWALGDALVGGAVFACLYNRLSSPGRPRDRRNVMAQDPVCGMQVDEKTAAGRVEHEGKTYHFCSAGCMKRFKENPRKFVEQARSDREEKGGTRA